MTQPEPSLQKMILTGRFSVKENSCYTSPGTGPSHTAAARPKGEQHPAYLSSAKPIPAAYLFSIWNLKSIVLLVSCPGNM